MPLLLLIPLLLAGVAALWALLLPIALIQRYRRGRARRRAIGWAVTVNAWLLTASALLLIATAWGLGHWIDGALRHALIGLLAGVVVGIAGVWLTRFEPGAAGLYYTPNRWLVLAVTVLVAARIAFGLLRGWQLWQADAASTVWLDQQAGLLAVGGLLLGYYLAYTWGLRRRVLRMAVVP